MSILSPSIVGIFGVLIVLLSIWGIAVPNRLIDRVKGAMSKPWGLYVAVGARLVLGAALTIAAPTSMFPTAFRVLGWLAIAAAVALPFVGRVRIDALLGWFEGKPTLLIRIWLIFGVAVGAFLVHAVWSGLNQERHGVGRQFEPLASRLKFELITNGSVR